MNPTTTATVARPTSAIGQPDSLAGTGQLLRFMLRRDRVRMPAWILGLTVLMAYFAGALGVVMDDEESLVSMATLVSSPVTALIGGPGYGYEDITIPRLLAGLYGGYVMIGAALMSLLTISRHTRVEEQTGRAELVRANVVGRNAQLTAALIMAVGMNLAVSVLLSLVVLGSGIEPSPDAGGAFLLGASIGAVGLVFAGAAAITAQLSAFSRAGSGIAGAVLGGAFVIRGLGDMSAAQDGGLAWLSWLSPLGWSQQAAPFTLDRWWPLLISVGLTLVLIAVGFALQTGRDLAAGILADRLGAARAPGWLGSPLALAFRIQRPSLIGWSVAIALAAITFGAFTQPMSEGIDGMPEEIRAMMGGESGIVEGYLGFMGVYFAIFLAVYAILTVHALRGEEQGVRAEPVLAAAVSRPAWLLSWTAVAALGALWLFFLAGLGEAIGASAGTGDWSLLGPTLLGHTVHVATAWFLLGLATALYGLFPRLVGLVWPVFIAGAFLTMFGQLMDLDQALLDISPFQHIGQHPAEEISWGAVAALTAVALALTAVGAATFRRRDLITS